MKFVFSLLTAFVLVTLGAGMLLWSVFGPVGGNTAAVFVVPEDNSDFDLVGSLSSQHLIKSEQAFRLLDFFYGPESVVPGGYRLHTSMHAWELLSVFFDPPKLVWVRIREGLRKEQIGEILGAKLGWDSSRQVAWNAYTNESVLSHEGIYFPDVYLLPSDEPVEVVAKQFTDRFNEKVRPYLGRIREKNMTLASVVTMASLLEREAAGAHDMPLIAGIMWNRINDGMRLDIDATLQYIKGNSEEGWWTRVRSSDKFLVSPYNTYRNTGLPPTPISNPGLTAIEAVLHPASTDCIFYLHAPDREIHCARTYAEHVENIEMYLR